MASRLERLADQRLRFYGDFVRYGTRPGFRRDRETIVLLQNIRRADTGEIILEQQWFRQTRDFAAISPLREGEVIAFDARVTPSANSPLTFRRYLSNSISLDYKLSRPTKVQKLG